MQGNIVCLYQKNSQVETIVYTAFGEELNSKAALSPWRFSSKRFDLETQFVYFGRRYYSPSHGRWMTPDPLSHESGPNLYAYVSNNPLSYFDLYGLEPQKPLETGPYSDRGRQISDRSLPPGERSVWDSVRDGGVSARDTAISGISNASQGFLDSHTRPYDTLKGQACENDDWFSRICHSVGAGVGFGFQAIVAFETGGASIAGSRFILSRYGMQRLGPKTIKDISLIGSKIPQAAAISNIFKRTVGKDGLKFDINILSKMGQQMDRSGLTKAGRALDKHGNRLNSPFPKATGNAASKNAQGQFHLDDILTDPKSICIKNKSGEIKYYAPDGRGAHFWSDGTFKGFIERSYENY